MDMNISPSLVLLAENMKHEKAKVGQTTITPLPGCMCLTVFLKKCKSNEFTSHLRPTFFVKCFCCYIFPEANF